MVSNSATGVRLSLEDSDRIDEIALDLMQKGVWEEYPLKETTYLVPMKCPICGHKLFTNRIGNSYSVYCETPDCVSYEARGL
jgi:hypothetical protein